MNVIAFILACVAIWQFLIGKLNIGLAVLTLALVVQFVLNWARIEWVVK